MLGFLSNPYKKKKQKALELEKRKLAAKELKDAKLVERESSKKAKSLSQFLNNRFKLIQKLPPKKFPQKVYKTEHRISKVKFFRPVSAFSKGGISARKLIPKIKKRRPITTVT